MGHEMLKSWEKEVDFKEIAILNMNEIDEKVIRTLKIFCKMQ